MTRSVLVIEDEQQIAKLVQRHLQDLACSVTLAYGGDTGLKEAESKGYDLIILDLMLPGMDGLEVCRRLRAKSNYTPILMLTAKSTELDRVLGLEMGADDYLTKPFSFLELVSRVKAIFRRMDALAATSASILHPLSVGELTINPAQHEVTLRGESVELTTKEFDLLLHFAQNPGRVYTRSQLLDVVWGYKHEGYEHAVNCHINRLRAKIEEDQANPKYILTVRGVGYKFTGNPGGNKD